MCVLFQTAIRCFVVGCRGRDVVFPFLSPACVVRDFGYNVLNFVCALASNFEFESARCTSLLSKEGNSSYRLIPD